MHSDSTDVLCSALEIGVVNSLLLAEKGLFVGGRPRNSEKRAEKKQSKTETTAARAPLHHRVRGSWINTVTSVHFSPSLVPFPFDD